MKSAACVVAIVLSCSLSAVGRAHPPDQSGNGAERTVFESFYDRSDSLYSFPCTADGELVPFEDGEMIQMEGQVYERWSTVIDGAGKYHTNINVMPLGLRGTSVETGEEFRVSEENRTMANQRLEGGSGMFRQVIKMVGTDTHRQFRLVAAGNYSVSKDGIVISDRFVFVEDCR